MSEPPVQMLSPLFLLRQVKFLSQEEEEARAGFENKKAVFLEEISRLQGTVSKERAALAAARAEEGRGGELERQRYERCGLNRFSCVFRLDWLFVATHVCRLQRQTNGVC